MHKLYPYLDSSSQNSSIEHDGCTVSLKMLLLAISMVCSWTRLGKTIDINHGELYGGGKEEMGTKGILFLSWISIQRGIIAVINTFLLWKWIYKINVSVEFMFKYGMRVIEDPSAMQINLLTSTYPNQIGVSRIKSCFAQFTISSIDNNSVQRANQKQLWVKS